MRIERRFTREGQSPYADIAFKTATSEIRNPDGSVVFRLADIDVPEQFSQVATDILAQKYFRKAGVPARAEERRGRDRSFLAVALGGRRGRPGRSARRRTLWLGDGCPPGVRPACRHLDLLGLEGRLFRQPRTTRAPSSTNCATCWPARWCAPNSPQWFNTGLHWAYGIDGPAQGHYYVDSVNRQAGQVQVGL